VSIRTSGFRELRQSFVVIHQDGNTKGETIYSLLRRACLSNVVFMEIISLHTIQQVEFLCSKVNYPKYMAAMTLSYTKRRWEVRNEGSKGDR